MLSSTIPSIMMQWSSANGSSMGTMADPVQDNFPNFSSKLFDSQQLGIFYVSYECSKPQSH